MRKILTIGVILFLITTIGTAYAEQVTVDVPFEPNYELDGFPCSLSYNHALNLTQFLCGWFLENVTPEELLKLNQEFPEVFHETDIDRAVEVLEEPLVEVEKPEPKTIFEIEIEKLTEKLIEEGELPSHESQLLKALLSLQKECELGTEEGAPIQTYKLFTIATFEPYTHTDLGTKYILKEIELAIQECESQKILTKKVLGDQYLHIPSTNEPKIIYQTNATLPEDAQAKYDEAKMIDYFAQKSKNDAEDYKCTKEGKARGLGFDCKTEESQVIPEPSISQAGREVLSKYNAYQQTGIADIPVQEPDAELDKSSIARQYLKAAGYSNEQIDAAIEALEDEDNELSEP